MSSSNTTSSSSNNIIANNNNININNNNDSSSSAITLDNIIGNNNNNNNSNNNVEKPDELSLRVKSLVKKEDVNVHVWTDQSVGDLKQTVRQALGPNADGRYLRLICRGRLLAPDSATLRDFPLRNGDVLHAVLAAAGVSGGQQALLATGATRRNRGAGVNANGRAERPITSDEDDEDDFSDEEEGRERLGFDRLRSAALSRHEIRAIRGYFSRQVDRYVQHHPNVGDDEADPRRRRLLQEDAWMQTQGETSEFRTNLNQNTPLFPWNTATTPTRMSPELFRTSIGTDRDFLWGFLLGFFVGFLMLVWVWMPTVPHKQKLGILTGISLQLALSLLRARDDEPNLEDGV